MARYALLRHTGAPDDPSGCHFDLLLEECDHCRTWRLADVPTTDGQRQPAVPIAPHRLVWLEPRSAAVSGNRGWAERVMAGTIDGNLPRDPDAPVVLNLVDGDLRGILRIVEGHCSITRA